MAEKPDEPHGGFGERRIPEPPSDGERRRPASPGDTEPRHPTEQRLNQRIPEGVVPRDSKKEGN